MAGWDEGFLTSFPESWMAMQEPGGSQDAQLSLRSASLKGTGLDARDAERSKTPSDACEAPSS